jgi:hypothetical protein
VPSERCVSASGTKAQTQSQSKNLKNQRWYSRTRSCSHARKGTCWLILKTIHGSSDSSAHFKMLTISTWSWSIFREAISWTYSWKKISSPIRRHSSIQLKYSFLSILYTKWNIFTEISNLITYFSMPQDILNCLISDCASIHKFDQKDSRITSSKKTQKSV